MGLPAPLEQSDIRHDGRMRPRLEQISDSDDWLALRTLGNCPDLIDKGYVDSLGTKTRHALGRYGARAPTLALRASSAQLLRDGLLAEAIVSAYSLDSRDTMVGYAPHFYCAQRIGLSPPELFDQVAERFEMSDIADLLRTFGSRQDVTLSNFAWKLVETPSGPDFESTMLALKTPWGP
jgi:hypothetical protein